MHNMNNMRNNSTHLSKSRIKQIQKALKGLGYYLQVDGNWGRGTIDDIKDLQFKNGLKVTGKPDANTLRALGLKGNHGSGMTRPGTSSTSRGMHNGMRGGMHNANMNRSNNNSMHNGRNTRTGTRNSNRNMRNMNTPSSATSMQSHRRTMRNGQRGMQNAQQGMHMRMSEMQIQHLQMKLDNKGYQVDQSGKWNNETRSAILRFQKQNGLKTTGQPDRKTRKALGITNTMWQSWAGSSSGTRSPSARTR
jgi:peptidoglycan hydrolase-like protein with peptidoglycan-binding domain